MFEFGELDLEERHEGRKCRCLDQAREPVTTLVHCPNSVAPHEAGVAEGLGGLGFDFAAGEACRHRRMEGVDAVHHPAVSCGLEVGPEALQTFVASAEVASKHIELRSEDVDDPTVEAEADPSLVVDRVDHLISRFDVAVGRLDADCPHVGCRSVDGIGADSDGSLG